MRRLEDLKLSMDARAQVDAILEIIACLYDADSVRNVFIGCLSKEVSYATSSRTPTKEKRKPCRGHMSDTRYGGLDIFSIKGRSDVAQELRDAVEKHVYDLRLIILKETR